MRLAITINGIDVTEHVPLDSISIQRGMAPTVGTASLSLLITNDLFIPGLSQYVTPESEEFSLQLQNLDKVVITDDDIGSTGAAQFTGFITKISFEWLSPTETLWSLSCQDATILLDTAVLPDGTYADISDAGLIQTVLSTHIPEIDTSDVQIVIPVLSYNPSDATLRRVITDVADMSGAEWYLDGEERLHYHLLPAATAPFGITDSDQDCIVTDFSRDYTGRANRVIVLGGIDVTTGVAIRVTAEDAAHQSECGKVYALTVIDRSITVLAIAQLRAQAELSRRPGHVAQR